ncbi:hypothetical protein, partial [Mesorhizobium sp. P5_C1]
MDIIEVGDTGRTAVKVVGPCGEWHVRVIEADREKTLTFELEVHDEAVSQITAATIPSRGAAHGQLNCGAGGDAPRSSVARSLPCLAISSFASASLLQQKPL